VEKESGGTPVNSTLLLKNMTTNCCIYVIKNELEKIGVMVNGAKLGEVNITYHINKTSFDQIKRTLQNYGFDIIVDKEIALVEQIKIAVIELIHLSNNANSIIRNSDYLVDKLHLSYQHMSSIFSRHHNTTLEKYIIHQ